MCKIVPYIIIVLIFGFVVLMIVIDAVTPLQKVTITNADLTSFKLTGTKPTNSLSYNLTFTMTIYNSVWHSKADYQNMEVICSYNSEKFDSVKLRNFTLGPKKTHRFDLSRSGNSAIHLEGRGIDDFRRSSKTGRSFDFKIQLKGRRIFSSKHGDDYLPISHRCMMRLKLSISEEKGVQECFKPVKCN